MLKEQAGANQTYGYCFKVTLTSTIAITLSCNIVFEMPASKQRMLKEQKTERKRD